jgi:hypothetical protein
MNNFTTETYSVKREILTYSNKISSGAGKPDVKFVADMVYGMCASGSVLLSDVSDALKESISKANTVDRLSRHLQRGLPRSTYGNYIDAIKGDIPDDPVILLDNSDVVKPLGKKFESMGRVKDGSADGVRIENGYWITEAVALSKMNQPISLYSHVYSQTEKNFVSENAYSFRAVDAAVRAMSNKGKATFICDRGYDMNKMFDYFYKKEQYFVIRLTANRKLFFKGKWYSAPTLARSRKGKFKTNLRFRRGDRECYVSVLNVRITGSRRPLRLVMIYGLGEMPMMLATNRPVKGKEDAVGVCRMYLSRWRVEEYFRFKKQHFGFEGFRVRKLKSINALNQLLTYAIPIFNRIACKPRTNTLREAVYRRARAMKKKVLFDYYRVAKGVAAILAYAKTGVKEWYKPRPRIRNPQTCMKLAC